jgi:ubiquitin
MENVRKHKNVELCHREKRMKKLAAKPIYKTHRIFSEDLVAVELQRVKVNLNKPMYVGMCILDLSKHLMYDFYHNHLKSMYGEKLQLQMTDTDSFLFYCETENIFDDMKAHSHLYDTSDFPKNHPLQSDINKKVLGKMKSETNEKCISEFVGLRSKMYAYSCDNRDEKRAKGISKVTVNKDLRLDSYKHVLFEESQLHSKMTLIRSHNHEIYCEDIVKTGLSCFDDKRYLQEDGISSLAYGHYKINK